MDIHTRIEQFEHMTREDPANDMAHFSLGGAYAAAGRHREAAESYLRCIELNPSMSRAYQLAGEAMLQAGQDERAGEIFTRGYRVAAERGDMLPKRAIAERLESMGLPVPQVQQQQREAPEGSFVCWRTGRPGTQMERPPFRGPLGAWIRAHISKETFDAWIGQGTKVINELRLDLSREADAEMYDRHMREYLGIDDDLYDRIRRGEEG